MLSCFVNSRAASCAGSAAISSSLPLTAGSFVSPCVFVTPTGRPIWLSRRAGTRSVPKTGATTGFPGLGPMMHSACNAKTGLQPAITHKPKTASGPARMAGSGVFRGKDHQLPADATKPPPGLADSLTG